MRITQLLWDKENLEHIAQHGVTPEEVEEVFEEGCEVRKVWKDRYAALGQTAAGRYLFVVFAHRGRGRIRPITARDMTLTERRLYLRR